MKTKTLYGNAFNLSGLYSERPMKLHYCKDTKRYWDDEGNFDSDGYSKAEHGYENFISKSKREVEIWIQGAMAVGRSLRNKFPK